MNLHKKILELQQEVTHVQKDSTNTHFKYKYVSESALIDAVMEKFSAKGLIVIPDLMEMRTFELCGKPTTEVIYEYTVIDAETGESLKSRAGGMEQGDKCAFKAMTGANKYYWLRFLQVSTGDDPERDEAPTPLKRAQAERAAQPVSVPPQAGGAPSPIGLKRQIREEMGKLKINAAQAAIKTGVDDIFNLTDPDLLTQVLEVLKAG